MYEDPLDDDYPFEGEPPTEERDMEEEEDNSLGAKLQREIDRRKPSYEKVEKSGGGSSRFKGKRPRSFKGLKRKTGNKRTPAPVLGKRTKSGRRESDPASQSYVSIVEMARKPFMSCMSDECDNQTTRHSGYCDACEKELGPYLTRNLLRCANCPVRATCPSGQNRYGVCLYEHDFDKDKVKEKDEVEQKMLEILHRDEKIVNRFFIMLNSINLNTPDGMDMYSKLAKDMKQWNQLFFDHLRAFGTFKGWSTATKEEVEKFKMQLKGVQSVLGTGIRRKQYKVKSKGDPLKEEEKELPPHFVKITVPPVSAVPDESGRGESQLPATSFPTNSATSNTSPSSLSSEDVESVQDIEDKIAMADDTMDVDLKLLEEMQEEFEKNMETEGSSLTGLSDELGWSSDKDKMGDKMDEKREEEKREEEKI